MDTMAETVNCRTPAIHRPGADGGTMKELNNGFFSIYFCGSEDCEPGHNYGPALRPHYLFHFIRSGKGKFYRKGEEYALETGNAFLISPLESTSYQADQEDPWFYTWVGFDGPAVETLLSGTCFADSCVFNRKMNPEEQERFLALLDTMLKTWQREGSSYTLMGKFLELLEFMRISPRAKLSSDAAQYVQKAKDYIDNNYSYPIRIADVAQFVGIDRTYLYRIFMEKERISPKQYLLHLRIRTATKLLCSTSYSITEIAFYCGFNDSAAFCNQFKDVIGISPSRYRKREKDKDYCCM